MRFISKVTLQVILFFICTQGLIHAQSNLEYRYSNGIVSYTYSISKESGDKIVLTQNITKANNEKKTTIFSFREDEVSIWQDEIDDCIILECKSGGCLEYERIAYLDNKKGTLGLHVMYFDTEGSSLNEIHKEILVYANQDDKDEKPVTKRLRTISLEKSSSGVFFIDATLNKYIDETFILDTGASYTCINMALWERLKNAGIASDKDIKDTVQSRIADGSIVDNYLVNLSEFKVGDFVFKDLEVLLSPNSFAPLLLGQNVMNQFGKFMIDFENEQIILQD